MVVDDAGQKVQDAQTLPLSNAYVRLPPTDDLFVSMVTGGVVFYSGTNDGKLVRVEIKAAAVRNLVSLPRQFFAPPCYSFNGILLWIASEHALPWPLPCFVPQ